MNFVEIDKFKFMEIEVDILNLKHGPYVTEGDQDKTTLVVSTGAVCRLRQRGVTKYYATPDLV